MVEPRDFSFGEKPLQFYVPGRIPYEEVTNMGHVTCTLRVRIRVALSLEDLAPSFVTRGVGCYTIIRSLDVQMRPHTYLFGNQYISRTLSPEPSPAVEAATPSALSHRRQIHQNFLGFSGGP
jgi:hypothetical protein